MLQECGIVVGRASSAPRFRYAPQSSDNVQDDSDFHAIIMFMQKSAKSRASHCPQIETIIPLFHTESICPGSAVYHLVPTFKRQSGNLNTVWISGLQVLYQMLIFAHPGAIGQSSPWELCWIDTAWDHGKGATRPLCKVNDGLCSLQTQVTVHDPCKASVVPPQLVTTLDRPCAAIKS